MVFVKRNGEKLSFDRTITCVGVCEWGASVWAFTRAQLIDAAKRIKKCADEAQTASPKR